jgi:hypothetical protein
MNSYGAGGWEETYWMLEPLAHTQAGHGKEACSSLLFEIIVGVFLISAEIPVEITDLSTRDGGGKG